MYSIQTGNTITGATSISQFHQHQITVGARDKFSPPFMFNLEHGYTVRNFIIATTQTQDLFLFQRRFIRQMGHISSIFPTSDHHGFLRIYVNGSSEPSTLTTVHLQPQIKQCMKLGLYRFGIPDDFKTLHRLSILIIFLSKTM